MRIVTKTYPLFIVLLVLSCAQKTGMTQQAGPDAAFQNAPQATFDYWPRIVTEGANTFILHQPQVDSWTGNTLTARTAVEVQTARADKPHYGIVWFSARTEIDKKTQMVLLEDFQITKNSFPTAPDKGASFCAALKIALPKQPVKIALCRLQAQMETTDAAVKPATVAVINTPPRIIFSIGPAILVLIDGKPVLRKAKDKDSNLLQVINTGVLLLSDKAQGKYYLWLSDRWAQASSLDGPWTAAAQPMESLNAVKKQADESAKASFLANAYPQVKQVLEQGGIPAIYVSTGPAYLVQTQGEPDLEPIPGTTLRYARNTYDDILFDMLSMRYYILVGGRWYNALNREGPWTFVAGKDLPPDFTRIPPLSPKGRVLASVPGTPQARQAVVAATTPQTATISRTAKATVAYDGAPQFQPIDGTSLQYAVNSSSPVIRVDAKSYYMVDKGVWYAATSARGPWTVAASVPADIYAIPVSSPLHYVTYVYVYSSTPEVVYTGYTPGYYGAYVTPYNTVVYGTGYMYPAWAGAVWYPPPGYYDYYDTDYNTVHTTYDGKYVQRGYSENANYTKAGDTTFAHTSDGLYATKDGNVYQRTAGGWQKYDASTGDWNMTNYSKAKDAQKVQDHRQGDASQTATAASGRSGQDGFGNRSDGGSQDNSRELDNSFSSRSAGDERSFGSGGGGFGGGGFGGGGFGGGGFGGGGRGGGRR